MSVFQSRLFWCTIVSAITSTASAALSGHVPDWLIGLLSSAAAGASCGGAYLRTQDYASIKPPADV